MCYIYQVVPIEYGTHVPLPVSQLISESEYINNTLGLNYYDEINYAPLSELLRQARIKTENKLMVFSDSIWKDCPKDQIIGSTIYLLFTRVDFSFLAHKI